MKEVLSSYMEEYADELDRESNVGLVVDGEVCKNFSADTKCFCFMRICIRC